MFDYDEIEEASPSSAEPAAKVRSRFSTLRSGETPGPPGFAQRAQDDPLRCFFPLRHLVLLDEWIPPDPPGIQVLASRGGSRQPQRIVLCVGPPSASSADWTALDAFGGNGTENTGNALVQLANRSRDELLVFDCTDTDKKLPPETLAKELALLLLLHTGPWIGVGVSVGAWLLAALISVLPEVSPRGAEVVQRCEHLHMVGFPPPDAGLSFSRPQEVEEADWGLAWRLGTAPALGRGKFTVPNNLSVYHFVHDTVFTRERMFGWFKLQPSLQDGSTKGAYPFYGLQGGQAALRHPRHRTELYWALANSSWESGPPLFAAPPPQLNEEQVRSWWEAMPRIGHGPPRESGLFDEANDVVFQELESSPTLKRFTNYHGSAPAWFPSENYCGGNAGARNGLDIRMYADTASSKAGDPVGCRTISAIRFGNAAGINVFPGHTSGVHGGAIQAVMDEVTAICCRVWWSPQTTTRKITHQISRPAYQFQTYKAVCEIESRKNDGAVIVVKGKLLDLLGEVVCITTSEMLDFERMRFLQHVVE